VEQWLRFPTIDSTNTFVKTYQPLPVNGLLVVSADRQTGGRGQRGNAFFSDTVGGLWASIVAPIGDIGAHFTHNRAIIMGIFDAVRSLAPEAPLAIKWPNDLYWGRRKMCGILLESMPGSARHLIIGFGVNVNVPLQAFPEGPRTIATSIEAETGRRHDVPGLLDAVVDAYASRVVADQTRVHEEYRARLLGVGACAAIGDVTGTILDVLPDGRLCLGVQGGTQYFSSGPMRFV